MNKLTKVGFSALCGSLAAIASANAGDMTVTGGVDMSWVSLANQDTGNPIGIGSNLTFKGSTEFDNGWTADYTVANLNGNAFSSAAVAIGMGGLGKLNINGGDSGNGIKAMDDKIPTAWEEVTGAGLSTGIKNVGGISTSTNIQYTTPTIAGITLVLAHAPAMGQADTADKVSGGGQTTKGKGYDATININPSMGTEILSGLNIYVGAHYTERNINSSLEGDLYEAVSGITYSLGPVSLGFARSGFITGQEDATAAFTHYKGAMYGVAFNVNDDLSISWGHHEMQQFDDVGTHRTGQMEDLRAQAQSWQVAYTMGGASLRLAETKGDNLFYTKATHQGATTVSGSLAF